MYDREPTLAIYISYRARFLEYGKQGLVLVMDKNWRVPNNNAIIDLFLDNFPKPVISKQLIRSWSVRFLL